jgi:hypothetical protein
MSLMLTSIDSNIGSTLLYLPIVKDIWECLQHVSGYGNITFFDR